MLGGILPLSTRFFPKVWGMGQVSLYMVEATSKIKLRGDTFQKMGDTWYIIQGDSSAGYCFVLKDLIPMKFFK